jgi:sirohydrochlorin ferrochelatase
LPKGEPRLVRILHDQLVKVLDREAPAKARVVLVDHGSPIPEVTAVRAWLAGALRGELGADTPLFEAVMERRAGSEYDFNGPLLEEVLERLAAEQPGAPIVLSMLFLSPGRHAGSGGDIEQICETVRQRHRGLRIRVTPLVAEHPVLVDILADRLAEASKSA